MNGQTVLAIVAIYCWLEKIVGNKYIVISRTKIDYYRIYLFTRGI